MNSLKMSIRPLLVVCFLFSFALAFGATDQEGMKTAQEGQKQQESKKEGLPSVELEEVNASGGFDQPEGQLTKPEKAEATSQPSKAKAQEDESSLSKFNYVFYFIYKYKYDQEAEVND
jgi:hypothetical protein